LATNKGIQIDNRPRNRVSVPFICVEQPQANQLTIGILAAVAGRDKMDFRANDVSARSIYQAIGWGKAGHAKPNAKMARRGA
jgi:hypothetical protein